MKGRKSEAQGSQLNIVNTDSDFAAAAAAVKSPCLVKLSGGGIINAGKAPSTSSGRVDPR